MVYRVIRNGKVFIVREIGDFINLPVRETIDCETKEGMKRYKKLFTPKRRQRKSQKSPRHLGTRQTTLDEFFYFNCSNQHEFVKVLTPVVEPPTCSEEGKNRDILSLPKREMIMKHVKKLKADHQSFGRSRIKKELPEYIKCSESTISRILREQQLQNPPKRLASEVKMIIWCPSLASYTGESFSLDCNAKNGIILILFLFQHILEPLIKPFLTKKEIKHVLTYSLGMLSEKPVYQCLEVIPPRIMKLLGFDKVIKLKNIPSILKTLGSHKDGITSEKIRNSKPNKLALDEKVIERYSKKAHIDTHDDTCQAGYFYCSRRNKSVLAESIEVIADISQEGIALPLYFTFTPHSLTKKEQAMRVERDIVQQSGSNLASPETKNSSSVSKPAKMKRTETVFLLLDVISRSMGQLPLRFDNNYAQKESIRRLQGKNWSFIGHGKSNLIIGKVLKKRMIKENLKYARENVDSADHGGPIYVVGYKKNGRVHLYLTNETNHESAKAIIEEYRDRWRLENTFKWTPSITLLSGSDPTVHVGQLIIALYFLAYLVHYFRAATPTIVSLLERPASVLYENNILIIKFPKIRKYYWKKLVNLQRKLCETQFSYVQISHENKGE